jgi:hypothetical protein
MDAARMIPGGVHACTTKVLPHDSGRLRVVDSSYMY